MRRREPCFCTRSCSAQRCYFVPLGARSFNLSVGLAFGETQAQRWGFARWLWDLEFICLVSGLEIGRPSSYRPRAFAVKGRMQHLKLPAPPTVATSSLLKRRNWGGRAWGFRSLRTTVRNRHPGTLDFLASKGLPVASGKQLGLVFSKYADFVFFRGRAVNGFHGPSVPTTALIAMNKNQGTPCLERPTPSTGSGREGPNGQLWLSRRKVWVSSARTFSSVQGRT